jgi:hypothetical protein
MLLVLMWMLPDWVGFLGSNQPNDLNENASVKAKLMWLGGLVAKDEVLG